MADPAVPAPEGPFDAPTSLAEQALANLVHQFARPLDLVRELAQNAIDAGSPRIAFTVSFEPPQQGQREGVLQLHVQDWGEGMDEHVIDAELTRLFASSKEHDLTKIGKFGVGFASIFALRPEAILLRTGRHGEAWELLFHPDRTFDKVKLSVPVIGTELTLYKALPEARVAAFVEELRFVLGYWCEHSDTPITLQDATRPTPPTEPFGDDPFAPFASPASQRVEVVNQPLSLGADLELRHTEPGIEVAIGTGDPPKFGFYNGGLTLLHTRNPEVLGRHRGAVGHLSFKVKHDHLEHTFTRDSVLHDEHWERAMAAVLRAGARLRDRLVAHIEALVPTAEPLDRWHGHLAAECAATGAEAWREALGPRALFRDQAGSALTCDAVRAQEARVGRVLLTSARPTLDQALLDLGLHLVVDAPGTRKLLLVTDAPPLFDFLRGRRTLHPADEVFVQPSAVPREALTPAEGALVARTEMFLHAAVGTRLRLVVGDFGGTDLGRTEVLALDGPADGRVFARPTHRWPRLPALLHWRTLLVNRHHPLFRAQLLAAAEDLDLGAYGLAAALLTVEGVEGQDAFRRLFEQVATSLNVRSGP